MVEPPELWRLWNGSEYMSRFSGESDAAPVSGYLQRRFTPARANRALVLVRRIVADVVIGYRRLMELQEVVDVSKPGETLQEARSDVAHLVQELHCYLEELNEIGVEVRDLELGIVNFPCQVDGRYICLCWRLGEHSVRYWHELGESFAQRQPIESLVAEMIAMGE